MASITTVGVIRGRDALFLDEAHYLPTSLRLVLRGDLTCSLCSLPPATTNFTPYELSFLGVCAFQVVELELNGWQGESSFDEVHQSIWLTQLSLQDHQQTLNPKHRHYAVQTYDYVFNVIAKSYQLWLPSAADSQ